MDSESGDAATASERISSVGSLVDVRTVALLLVGIAGGYGVVALGSDVVAVPLVGAVPGPLAGGVALVFAAVGYRRFGCGCSSDCGCSGDCGDSCSYDP